MEGGSAADPDRELDLGVRGPGGTPRPRSSPGSSGSSSGGGRELGYVGQVGGVGAGAPLGSDTLRLDLQPQLLEALCKVGGLCKVCKCACVSV